MSYAIQKFKSYGTKSLSVGGQYVLTDFALPKSAMVTAIGINIESVLKNADTGADRTVTQKELLSKIGLTLACGAPVSATIFASDARACTFANGIASGQFANNPASITVPQDDGTADFDTFCTIPFGYLGTKRAKDFNLPGVALESLTVSLNGAPYAADADVTWNAFNVEVVCFYYEAEALSWGPVVRWRSISVSEDTRSYTGKLLAVASLPPVGKVSSDYPTVTVSNDGLPQYDDTTGGIFPLVAYGATLNQSNGFSWTGGNGEDISKLTWILDGGSILDAASRTVEVAYKTSLTTALGGSDTVLVADLVNYAKPDGAVKVAVPGAGLRGSLENLPVEAN